MGGGEALYIRANLECVSGPLCEMQFTERDGRIEQISVNYLF